MRRKFMCTYQRISWFKTTLIFFNKKMYSYFRKLFVQWFPLVYFDEILSLSHSKSHLIDVIAQLNQISNFNKMKSAPEKPFFKFLKVKFLGHVFGNPTITSTPKLKHYIDQTVTRNHEHMIFLGCTKFYSNFFF